MRKFLLLATVLANGSYIVWLYFHVTGTYGGLFFIAEVLIISLTFLFTINHWSQKHTIHAQLPPSGTVDIFITVVDEPLDIVEPVVQSAVRIPYAQKMVYILDDGGREDLRLLARRHKIFYFSRPNKPQHYKAGNLNYALQKTTGDYILVLDADQEVIDGSILGDLLGHFAGNHKLAAVTTRQSFKVPPGDFNHDTMFYEHMQTGKNEDNAAISTVSGVIYCRQALEVIGGFQTWNIVEDLYTGYMFHCAGFETLYVNRAYTLGLAPFDVTTIYKQRGTWALDTLRLFVRDNPFLRFELSWKQRLHYAELAIIYLASAFAVPVLYILPIVSLLFDIHIVTDPLHYVFLRVPSLLLLMLMYFFLGGNSFTATQFWAALFPVYFKAFVLALLPGKPKYRVTRKVGNGQRAVWLVMPHVVLALLAVGTLVWRTVVYGADLFLLINGLFIALMLFWTYPLMAKGFAKY